MHAVFSRYIGLRSIKLNSILFENNSLKVYHTKKTRYQQNILISINDFLAEKTEKRTKNIKDRKMRYEDSIGKK